MDMFTRNNTNTMSEDIELMKQFENQNASDIKILLDMIESMQEKMQDKFCVEVSFVRNNQSCDRCYSGNHHNIYDNDIPHDATDISDNEGYFNSIILNDKYFTYGYCDCDAHVKLWGTVTRFVSVKNWNEIYKSM